MQIPAAQKPAGLRFRFLRSFTALILREMTTRYGNSPGGYLWAILEPVAALVLLSFVFSLMLRSPGLGDNFMYFYAGGVLPFGLYSAVVAAVAAAVRFSRPLLEYPAVSFIDAIAARFVLNSVTQILVSFIVIGGIIYYYQLSPILRWPSLILSFSMAMALGLGLGLVNCFFITAYPLWDRAWTVVSRPLFIMSGVMFIPEKLPPRVREVLLYNPLMHVTSEMRKGLFGTYDAVYVDPLYVFEIAVLLILVGMFLLQRYHKDLLLK